MTDHNAMTAPMSQGLIVPTKRKLPKAQLSSSRGINKAVRWAYRNRQSLILPGDGTWKGWERWEKTGSFA